MTILVRLPLLIGLVALFAAPARAEEDCLLNKQALQPALQAGREQSHQITKEDRVLKETLVMDNGMTVTFEVGGCVHYAYEFRFENIPASTEKENDPYKRGLSLLNRVPLQTDHEHLRTTLKQALEKGESWNDPEDSYRLMACGDATCTLSITENDVSISYDFPL